MRTKRTQANRRGRQQGQVHSGVAELPRFEKGDWEQLTHFVAAEHTIEPDTDHRFEVERVWLLVSQKVYSSSEAFAVFSKTTGYATLVGERTGGDGLGITPFHAREASNSGLKLWYLQERTA